MKVTPGLKTLRDRRQVTGAPAGREGGAIESPFFDYDFSVNSSALEWPAHRNIIRTSFMGGKGDYLYWYMADQTLGELPNPSYQPGVFTTPAPPFNPDWTAHRNTALRITVVRFPVDYEGMSAAPGEAVGASPLLPDTSDLQWTTLGGGQTGSWGIGYVFTDLQSPSGGGTVEVRHGFNPEEGEEGTAYFEVRRIGSQYTPGSGSIWNIYRSSQNGSAQDLRFTIGFDLATGELSKGWMWEGAGPAGKPIGLTQFAGSSHSDPVRIISPATEAHDYLFDESGFHYRIGNVPQHPTVAAFDLAASVNPEIAPPATEVMIDTPQSLSDPSYEGVRYGLAAVPREPNRVSGLAPHSKYTRIGSALDWLVYDDMDASLSLHQYVGGDAWMVKSLPKSLDRLMAEAVDGLDGPPWVESSENRWAPCLVNRASSSSFSVLMVEYSGFTAYPLIIPTGTLVTLQCSISGTGLEIDEFDYLVGVSGSRFTGFFSSSALIHPEAVGGAGGSTVYFGPRRSTNQRMTNLVADAGRTRFEAITEDGRDLYKYQSWIPDSSSGPAFELDEFVTFTHYWVTWERGAQRRQGQAGSTQNLDTTLSHLSRYNTQD